MRKVYVKWKDATGIEYINPDEIEKIELATFENIGFLVIKSKEFVVLAFGISYKMEAFDEESGIQQFRKVMVIPKCQIVEMYELRKK